VLLLFSDFYSIYTRIGSDRIGSAAAIEDRVVPREGAWQGLRANKAETSAPPAISVIYQSQWQFIWLSAIGGAYTNIYKCPYLDVGVRMRGRSLRGWMLFDNKINVAVITSNCCCRQ